MDKGSTVPAFIINLPLPTALMISPLISSSITSITTLLLAVTSRSTVKLKLLFLREDSNSVP